MVAIKPVFIKSSDIYINVGKQVKSDLSLFFFSFSPSNSELNLSREIAGKNVDDEIFHNLYVNPLKGGVLQRRYFSIVLRARIQFNT